MLDMLRKILATEKTVIPTGILFQDTDNTLLGEKTQLSQKIKRIFRGSLAIREVAAGSSNAEEQELTALTNSYYDIERFGVHFVAIGNDSYICTTLKKIKEVSRTLQKGSVDFQNAPNVSKV
jgi:hypothetical protein